MELCGDCQTKYFRIEKLQAENARFKIMIKLRDRERTSIHRILDEHGLTDDGFCLAPMVEDAIIAFQAENEKLKEYNETLRKEIAILVVKP